MCSIGGMDYEAALKITFKKKFLVTRENEKNMLSR